ncbi:hypothetical protein BKA70DRAFT_1417637 [Coprinopsis sp. MPI-PUGE-AT-0042]|nr:hypothetical protein BKA70DRAFT_1417637 [Coprinopsis sp. MPI-PUGE-AT-0042]
MPILPAPTLVVSREEWADADFDLPDGEPIHAPSDKDDFDGDEDWDLEMDLGSTGGAKAKAVVAEMAARSEAAKGTVSSSGSAPAMITIRPPLQLPMSDEDDEDGASTIKEGASTLKASGFPLAISARKQPLPQTIDEDDFEDGFALPSDLTQLSLAPVAVSRRGSKASLEWGEKDNTSSSQSSDAYSSLGFADNYQSSTSASSASLPETETEDDEDDLDGLVIPTALFESKQSSRQLNKILETKKKAEVAITERKVATPHPEEDFEAGLIIEDDVDLSPSKLLVNSHNPRKRAFNRSNTHPPARGSSTSLRPPSRAAKLERSKSPSNPPCSSARQLQKLRLSPSPPLVPPSRSPSYQTFSAAPPAPSPSPSPSSSFLSPKPGSLRNQKSHSGLKPPTPPSTTRLARKASLSVIESVAKQASRTSLEVPTNVPPPKSRYEEPTAASRAKSHKSSTSRMHDFRVPPTRPSTPSSNPAALRLTMPTQSRTKSRPALSQVFGGSSSDVSKVHATARAISPIPPVPARAPSSMSLRSQRHSKAAPPPVPTPPPVAAPKLLRKPKRTRTYGDGTELDALDDLPLDVDKESRFRVQPKGYGNRIPGATYEKDKLARSADKPSDLKGSLRASKRDAKQESIPPLTATTNTLRRTATRIEFPRPPSAIDILPKRRKGCSPGKTHRKPTLIRNLGGAGSLKVVGNMIYNPATLRWDGNEQVMREFDAVVGTSTRPALITQLTGSSGGSPAGSFANGARLVGTMYFDPAQMRWISTLPPDEDEPDVFANLADTEDDSDSWERKGDTIRAQQPRVSDASSIASCASTDSRNPRSGTNSPTDSHSRTLSDAGSERGSRASMVVSDVDEAFVQKCREAEARHWSEMKGWKTGLAKCDPYEASDRSHLYEIRALATRKY